MSASFNAGKPAGHSHVPPQADPDSPDGCEAPPAESGSEGLRGASPSNTAPHNSNTSPNALPDGFHLRRLAVDSLYLSYPGNLHPGVLSRLIQLKGLAQFADPVEQSKAQFVAGSHIFEVKDKGAGQFPFVLDDNAFRIQFSRPNKKLPMAYVKVSAEYLAHEGPRAIQEELETLLAELGNSWAGTWSVGLTWLRTSARPASWIPGIGRPGLLERWRFTATPKTSISPAGPLAWAESLRPAFMTKPGK